LTLSTRHKAGGSFDAASSTYVNLQNHDPFHPAAVPANRVQRRPRRCGQRVQPDDGQLALALAAVQARTMTGVLHRPRSITVTLVREGRLELRNFGIFQVKQRKSRKAHNPRTLETVKVPARLVVTFKPGREMEERVGKLKHLPNGRE
jgi:nucleoid DNA-binding protein